MKTFFGYVRVSTRKQGEGVSLQEQRAAIEAYAARERLDISDWFEELETAARQGRPVFAAMLKRLRKGEAAGIIIHKIDRSARNLRDWADLGELIDAGIDVRFATESLDMLSRGGRLSADIQAVVAADYIRNLKEETRKGFYGRLKQGLYPLPAPIGYANRGGGKVKEPDPKTAPFVRLAFELYATGDYSLDTLRMELKERGLTWRGGRTIHRASLAAMLRNPFYMGLIRLSSGETFPGKHEPLVGAAMFQRVQAILDGKLHRKERRHAFLYRSLLKCRACGRRLTGELQKGAVYYRCHGRDCRGWTLREEVIGDRLSRQLAKLRFSPDQIGVLKEELANYEASHTERAAEQRDAIDLQIGQAKDRLDRLTDAYVDHALPKEAFFARRESILASIANFEDARRAIERGEDPRSVELARSFELLKTALPAYEMARPPEKQDLLKSISSNRWAAANNVELELFPVFRELSEWPDVLSGGASRSAFRTWARKLIRDGKPSGPNASDEAKMAA